MFDPIYKSFETLPDCSERIPQPENPSKKTLALIPVFRDPYVRDKNVPAFIKAAAYARMSCLKNTDASEIGVEVKLYVQNTVQFKYADIFEANQIDIEKDVLIYSEKAPGLGNEIWGRLGKKTRSYYHFVLSEYDRIVCFDADMWFIDDKMLFRRLQALPTDMIAYIDIYAQKTADMKHRLKHSTYQNGLSVDEIFEIAKLTDLPETLDTPLGYFWTHPGKTLFTDMEHFDFISWIADNSGYIGEDEAIMALASYKFGYPLYALKAVADIDSIRVRDILSGKITDAKIAHGKAPYKKDTEFNTFLSNL